MRERLALYAKYGLWLGLACVLVALGAWLVVGSLALWIEIVGAVGIALLAAMALLRPNDLRAALTGRQARYGGNAALMSVAFVLIIILVNYLGARHHLRWDVTAEKQFSVSEQTINILDSLQEPVKVRLCFTPDHYNRQQASDMITEYALRSNGKLTYEFIDPDTQRRQALDYQVGRDGTIVFERGDKREITFGVQEQDLTSALLKVTTDSVRGVYFLTGHKERDPESSDVAGYSSMKQVLESENYKVAKYNIAVTDTIPADMAVLVAASPQTTLSADETAFLANYVNQGGSLLLRAEPGQADPFGGLLATYGLALGDDVIIDPTKSFFGDISAPLVDSYEFHQITKDLNGMSAVFPAARSVTIVDAPPADWTVQYLARTSANAWAETGYREKQVKADDNEKRGPLGLAAVAEPSAEGTGKGRVVLIGDAHFVENDIVQKIQGTANVDLFMNAIGWLAEEESLISIRPVEPEQRQIVLTPPQARAVIFSNILFVPLAVLIVGGIVWWRRR